MNKKIISWSIWIACIVLFLLLISQIMLNTIFNFNEKNLTAQINQYSTAFVANIDTSKFVNLKSNKLIDSTYFQQTLLNYLTDQKIDYLINKNLIAKVGKNLSILLGIFTAIFTIFTFFTQYQLNKADKLVNIVEEQKLKLEESFNKLKKDSELYKEQLQSYSNLIFLRFNDFIKEDDKYSISSIYAIMKLWNFNDVEEGAMILRDTRDKRSLPYLKNRLEFYSKYITDELEPENRDKYNSIILQLSEAINAINSIEKK